MSAPPSIASSRLSTDDADSSSITAPGLLGEFDERLALGVAALGTLAISVEELGERLTPIAKPRV